LLDPLELERVKVLTDPDQEMVTPLLAANPVPVAVTVDPIPPAAGDR
jgi:hypothetical protein